MAMCTAEQNDRWEIFKNLKNSQEELRLSILAASPGRGSYAEAEPDSKVSGLLWGVFSHHQPELLGKAALVYSSCSDSVRTCQTECRCTVLTEGGLRMGPLAWCHICLGQSGPWGQATKAGLRRWVRCSRSTRHVQDGVWFPSFLHIKGCWLGLRTGAWSSGCLSGAPCWVGLSSS